MRFTVYPLIGVNEVKFGMTPEQVRHAMNCGFETGHWRNPSKEWPTDHFGGCAFAYYDAEGRLDGLEFHAPAQVFVGGMDLLALPGSQAGSAIFRLDPQAAMDNDGVTSHRLSVSIWTPNADEEEDEPAETVLAARPGYFDFLLDPAGDPGLNHEITPSR